MFSEKIIKDAAERSGVPYPVDKETREFSESLLRSLDDGISWAHGKGNSLAKTELVSGFEKGILKGMCLFILMRRLMTFTSSGCPTTTRTSESQTGIG